MLIALFLLILFRSFYFFSLVAKLPLLLVHLTVDRNIGLIIELHVIKKLPTRWCGLYDVMVCGNWEA